MATGWDVDSAIADSGDEQPWATAFKTSEELVNLSTDGDRAIVAEGTYVKNINLKGTNSE